MIDTTCEKCQKIFKTRPDRIQRFCSRKCFKEDMAKHQFKDNNPNWRGGQRRFYHVNARKILEEKIGRKLGRNEVVHHTDGDRQNNKPENLVWMTRSEHSSYHTRLRNQGKKQ